MFLIAKLFVASNVALLIYKIPEFVIAASSATLNPSNVASLTVKVEALSTTKPVAVGLAVIALPSPFKVKSAFVIVPSELTFSPAVIS